MIIPEFKEKIDIRRNYLQAQGLSSKRIREILSQFAKHMVLKAMASQSFDAGIPITEGPVWFDHESWKTDFWMRCWECRKAYREGEKARSRFEGIEANPYKDYPHSFSTRKLQLEASWNAGFKSKPL